MKEFAVVSAFRAGLSQEENERRHAQLCEVLKNDGLDFHETSGAWDGVQEKAVFVAGMARDEVAELASYFGQDAYIWGDMEEYCVFDTRTGSIIGCHDASELSQHTDIITSRAKQVARGIIIL